MRPLLRRLLLVAGLLVGSTVVFLAGALLGALLGEFGAKQGRYSRERERVAPVLAGDPSFAGVSTEMFTGDGSAYLSGEVATKDDYERLRAEMMRLFGEAREVDTMNAVRTKEGAPVPGLQRTRPAPVTQEPSGRGEANRSPGP